VSAATARASHRVADLRRGACVALWACALVWAAGCGGAGHAAATAPAYDPVATIQVSPDSDALAVGDSVRLANVVRDAAGVVLTGRVVTWRSSDATVATVSDSGLVIGVGLGTATVTAASWGKTGQAAIEVTGRRIAGDLAIFDAHFTQGVQNSQGTIPMILSGGAVAFQALLRAVPPITLPVPVVLRLTDAGGATVWSDTARTGPLGDSAGYAAPSVEFLVPASVLASGLRWQIVRDPLGRFPDDSAADDVFPRAGPALLPTANVPPLGIHFVPITLTANGNPTGNVSPTNVPAYLRTVKSIYPVGVITADVGAPFETNADFGTRPNGGGSSFWSALLLDLALAHVADTSAAAAAEHWHGIVAPPAGFTYVASAGIAYVPESPSASYAGTRTSASLELNWFQQPARASEGVAHELGHTFGRNHSPCGNPGAGLDPNYPVVDGTLDYPGTDVHDWATGDSSFAAYVPRTTGDVMGYCHPVWASVYTYEGIFNFRNAEAGAVADRAVEPPTRVLVVRGTIAGGGAVTLLPALTLTARPTGGSGGGSYRLVGLDARGRILFSHDFSPMALDHDSGASQFILAVPLSAGADSSLATLRVSGPAGAATITVPPRGAESLTGPARRAESVRGPNGRVTVSCPAGTAGVLVLAGTARYAVSTSMGSSAELPVLPAGTALRVLCSDGVHTLAFDAAVPG
jgi:Bacterial Ig-like domain (group 2)